MDGFIDERPAIARGAAVGCQMDGDAALDQRRRERFGREQMPARPAGRDEDRRPARAACITPRSGRA